MPWNIDIELVSLLLLIILLVYFFSRQNIPSIQNKLFGLLLINSLVLNFLKILIYFLDKFTDFTPDFLIESLLVLFFILRGLLPTLIFMYVVDVTGKCTLKLSKIFIIQSLFYVSVISYLINPFTKFMFEYNNGTLIENLGGCLEYGVIGIYLIVCLVFTLIHIKAFSKRTLTAIAILTLGTMAYISIHLLTNANQIFTGIASTIALILMFFSLQNPVLLNDEDTKTFNRKAFEQILEQVLKKKSNIYIITVALDNFKLANQSFGIDNGTKLLAEVAGFMNTIVRKYKAFRYYADSFSIIISGEQDADMVIEKITKRFKDTWEVNGIVCTLSATTTIIKCPEHAKTLDEAALLIDFTLYEAKRSEKGQVFYCDETMKNKMHRLKQIELSIVRGFKNNSFEVYFQPIYSIEKGRFVSAEALARLYDDDLGYISPDEFITVAEANGTINNLGKMIFERTCMFLNKFNPQQFGIETISINLSVIQCMQKGFIDSLEDIMKKYNVTKDMIHFEITETSKSDSMGFFNSFLSQMNKHGFLLYLDDYGSGYSTLSYLTKLPFDTVKIDKSIVWDAEENDRSKKIISNTIQMLNQLNFNIIAEGVENKEQFDMLKEMGCHLIQGFYFCIPLSETDFIEFIKNNSK